MRRSLVARGGIALGTCLVALVFFVPGGLMDRWTGEAFPGLLPAAVALAGAWLGSWVAAQRAKTLGPWAAGRAVVLALTVFAVFLIVSHAGSLARAIAEAEVLTRATSDLLADVGRWLSTYISWQASLAAALALASWGFARMHRDAARALPKPVRAADLRTVIALDVAAHIAAAAVAVLVLRRGGALDGPLEMDVSFLLPIALISLLALAGLRLAEVRAGARLAGMPAGLARGFLVFLTALAVTARFPEMVHAVAESKLAFRWLTLADRQAADQWRFIHALAVATVTASFVWGSALRPLRERRWPSLAIRLVQAMGVIGAALLATPVFGAIAEAWRPAAAVATVMLWGASAVAAGVMLGGLSLVRHPIAVGLGKWAEEPVLRNLALGLGLGAYVVMVRPFLFRSLTFAAVLEWVMVVVAAWRLLWAARHEVERESARQENELAYQGWRRHEQEVVPLEDQGLLGLRGAISAFVDHGLKEGLLVALVRAIGEDGVGSRRATEVIRPLVAYEDPPPVRLAFPWERRRRAAAVRTAREGVVRWCLDALDAEERARGTKAQEARSK